MRLSGFTRIGAMIGFFGSIGVIIATIPLIDSDEVSLTNVILTEVLLVTPIFTMVAAAIGAGWDIFERRAERALEPGPDELPSPAEIEPGPATTELPGPRRRRRRKPPGGRAPR